MARYTALPAALSDPPTGPINIALLDRCIIQMSAETAQKYSSGFVHKARSECGFITDCRCLFYRLHNFTALQVVFIIITHMRLQLTTLQFYKLLFIISTRRLILP